MSSAQRLQSSGQNTNYRGDQRPFCEYITLMRDIIATTRCDLTPATHQTIIDVNSPADYYNEQAPDRGIVLIHGLLDSPYCMSSLAAEFRSTYRLVRVVLLPGHGTRPGDLLNVRWQEWHACVAHAINDMAQHVAHVTVLGFSTGGSLALYHAATSTVIDALILLAPAIRIQNPLAWLSGVPTLLGKIKPSLNWARVAADTDYAKYQSLPYNAIYQVHLLSKALKHKLAQHTQTVPLCLFLSNDDQIISVPAALEFFKSTRDPRNQCYVYTTPSKTTCVDQRQHFCNSYYPEKRILHFSHVCLPINPLHPYYGDNGAYQDYLHYEILNMPIPTDKPHYLGSPKLSDMRQYCLQRLTYNPDFDAMMQRITEFVATTV